MSLKVILLGIAAAFIPPAILVLVRNLLSKKSGTLKDNVKAYLYSLLTVNIVMLLFLNRRNPKDYYSFGSILFTLTRVSLKYIIVASAVAVILPIIEAAVKFIIRRIPTGGLKKLGFEAERPDGQYSRRQAGMGAAYVVLQIFLLLMIMLTLCMPWLHNYFPFTSIVDILYTLGMPLDGTSNDITSSFICLVPVTGLTIFAHLISASVKLHRHFRLFFNFGRSGENDRKRRRIRLFPISMLIPAVLLLIWASVLYITYDKTLYITKSVFEFSSLIEDEYVSPKDVSITFPEHKRNLIYIFLESAETTYMDKGSGGMSPDNYIPEMTELAKENISFSRSDLLYGPNTLTGSTYTMGGITAQHAGMPMRLANNMNQYAEFMPNLVTLGDILEDEGYHNYFMCGSDLKFAGRDKFFKQHGNYECFDYYSAIEEGKIPEDYKVFWGFEDRKLYEYAKEKLTVLAAEDRPFNFTMLTVDTHVPDGYTCELCGNEYEDCYANTWSCASKQVCEFIDWIKQQDFYENTTVVICGDHLFMGNHIVKDIDMDKRGVYNCFINSAAGPAAEKNRKFCTFDIFPTTLSAMGVEIEGGRLGIGTDLFSDRQTLCEEYGYDHMISELSKSSRFYNKYILR